MRDVAIAFAQVWLALVGYYGFEPDDCIFAGSCSAPLY